MNDKICQKCGKHNPLDMNFCLDCGQPLPAGGSAANLPGDSAPTVFAPPSSGNTNFQTPPQQQAANFATPPAKKKSRAGFWLAIIGGIGLIGVLIVVGIVGLVAANWKKIADESNNQNRSANLASPTPRRNANSTVNTTDPTPTATANDTDDERTTAVPRVKHERLWVDHDVKENGKVGMRVHAKFTTYNMKGLDANFAVYFMYRNGDKLTAINKTYSTTDGQVAAFRQFKPEYDPAVYNDITVFIPYTEFNIGKGKYSLKLSASVIYLKGGLIQHLEDYEFDYTY